MHIETSSGQKVVKCNSLPELYLADCHIGNTRLSDQVVHLATLKQHYYPEGGWGWTIVVLHSFFHVLTIGFVMTLNCLREDIRTHFGYYSDWLGGLSLSVSLIISPIVIVLCKRKSIRVIAVISGLLIALSCLFASFATKFHQVVISYGILYGLGVGISSNCSLIMIGQYFKRKRAVVEMITMSSTGLGLVISPTLQRLLIGRFGWRFGLQIFAAIMSSIFVLSVLYRPASLYHPQRRAILHLKNQRKKIKEKYFHPQQPTPLPLSPPTTLHFWHNPYIDFSCLQSKSVRWIMLSTLMISFGIYTPILSLNSYLTIGNLDHYLIEIFTIFGISWICGCLTFGSIVINFNVDTTKKYLCQITSFVLSLTLIAFNNLKSNHFGYVIFAISYGFCVSGYQYSLKMYVFEKMRSRNFAQTWSLVQFVQAVPIAIGTPVQELFNNETWLKWNYHFGALVVLVGSIMLFAISPRKTERNLKEKLVETNSSEQDSVTNSELGVSKDIPKKTTPILREIRKFDEFQITIDSEMNPKLASISEEAVADVEFIDDYLIDNLTLINDCNYDFLTSCDKDEKFLMLSEFENNLFAVVPKSTTFCHQ